MTARGRSKIPPLHAIIPHRAFSRKQFTALTIKTRWIFCAKTAFLRVFSCAVRLTDIEARRRAKAERRPSAAGFLPSICFLPSDYRRFRRLDDFNFTGTVMISESPTSCHSERSEAEAWNPGREKRTNPYVILSGATAQPWESRRSRIIILYASLDSSASSEWREKLSNRSMQGIPHREHRPCEWALFAPLNDEVARRLLIQF